MKFGRIALIGAVVIALALLLGAVTGDGEEQAQPSQASVPVLTVALTRAEPSMLPIRVPATGNVVAWQAASYLDARRGHYASQMALEAVRTQRQIALATLFRSLGGGWRGATRCEETPGAVSAQGPAYSGASPATAPCP